MHSSNFLQSIPDKINDELFEDLIHTEHVQLERIVSEGHSSPESGWYDQARHEWVMVIQGKAILQFDDLSEVTLSKNDYLNIPAHTKHRVKWTDPKQKTVWLAVHY